ncbi:cupin domain-containing protein [Govanella unica]|uniref:AraC family ligand binding domain-containing protein n=1 Tax=Govanella unica TaxID=2975056 RepID=A0A9X3TYP3_9PROT|nr:cupin domain-containing protein [Govania unica]MDA5194155.1 AraC family ligand binding domain-containing protein [Govania unica]
MQIKKLDLGTDEFSVTTLTELLPEGKGRLKIGTATFPKGKRYPETGLAPHAEREFSLVLEGALDIETADGIRRAAAGEVIIMNPGEPHASLALEDSKVFYVLFG